MRIVILGTRGFPNIQGGVEKHCEGLTVGLVKLGCEIIVFTRKPYVNGEVKEFKGVRLVTLPAFKHKSLEAFFHTFFHGLWLQDMGGMGSGQPTSPCHAICNY